MNTKGHGGRKLTQTIRVYTSDPLATLIQLTITGNVESYASIVPTNLRLKGRIGAPIKTMATITPEKKYPFAIVGSRARSGEFISYRITSIRSPKGPSFVLAVENTKNEPGRYYDTIHLTTDNAEIPEIQINVYGDIQPPDKPAGKASDKPSEKAKE